MNHGALCTSIDLELAWGIRDKPSAEYHRLCAEMERPVVHALLELFEAREVPVTWAVVGRLLDDSGEFPTQTPFGDRIWYAPDLVDAIRNASPRHEVATHSFGHICFPESDRDQVREDLRSARRIHEEHGLRFESLVFPRNLVAHVDLVAEAGIKVFRGLETGWHMTTRERLGSVPGRVAHLVDKLLPIQPPVVWPRCHPSGVVELPGSMLLSSRNGLRHLARPEIAETKAKLGLRRASREGATFHLWCHPCNFYRETGVQLRVLENVLDEACAMRNRGEIEIRTLASYAPVEPTSARGEDRTGPRLATAAPAAPR